MTKKKNKFWTFCFSLLPGAAEMYMGFMKMGVTLMSLFFGTIAVAALLEMPIILLLICIVWFYSFFHAHNLAGLSDEEFYAVEDHYLIDISEIAADKAKFIHSYRKIIAVVLIVMGTTLIWRGFVGSLYWYTSIKMRYVISFISNFLPKTVIGIAIIGMGVILIRGKKKELDEEEMKNGKDIGFLESDSVEDGNKAD